MVTISKAEFITSNKLHISTSIDTDSAFDNVYLKNIIIFDDTTLDNINCIPSDRTKAYILSTGKVKSFDTEIDVEKDIRPILKGEMLFIFVETDGTPSEEISKLPCGADAIFAEKIAVDYKTIYNRTVELLDCNDCWNIKDPCVTSPKLINFILEFNRLKLAIEYDNFNEAYEAFNMLLNKTKKDGEYHECNC